MLNGRPKFINDVWKAFQVAVCFRSIDAQLFEHVCSPLCRGINLLHHIAQCRTCSSACDIDLGQKRQCCGCVLQRGPVLFANNRGRLHGLGHCLHTGLRQGRCFGKDIPNVTGIADCQIEGVHHTNKGGSGLRHVHLAGNGQVKHAGHGEDSV